MSHFCSRSLCVPEVVSDSHSLPTSVDRFADSPFSPVDEVTACKEPLKSGSCLVVNSSASPLRSDRLNDDLL